MQLKLMFAICVSLLKFWTELQVNAFYLNVQLHTVFNAISMESVSNVCSIMNLSTTPVKNVQVLNAEAVQSLLILAMPTHASLVMFIIWTNQLERDFLNHVLLVVMFVWLLICLLVHHVLLDIILKLTTAGSVDVLLGSQILKFV